MSLARYRIAVILSEVSFAGSGIGPLALNAALVLSELHARLIFASRAVARFDGEQGGVWRTGFTYRTLAGHPELGEETFSVEKDVAGGEVRVLMRSWSQAGSVDRSVGFSVGPLAATPCESRRGRAARGGG